VGFYFILLGINGDKHEKEIENGKKEKGFRKMDGKLGEHWLLLQLITEACSLMYFSITYVQCM
jgi:hypothetical protein